MGPAAKGARRVFVMMEHLSKSGESKLVQHCTYPLTGVEVVDMVYTDLATLQVTPRGFFVVDRVDGLSHAELESLSNIKLWETQDDSESA